MKKKNLTKSLSKEIDRLNGESKKLDLQNEVYKNNLSEQLKNYSKDQILNKNNTKVKYTIWERLMRALGIN